MGTKKHTTRAEKSATKEAEQRNLICPHCNSEITSVQWRGFAEGGKVVLIGCGHCFKVFGSGFHF